MFSSLLLKISQFAAFDLGKCDPSQNQSQFFGFPHWWKYISEGHKDGLGKCVPEVKFPEGVWALVFAVVDMLLYLAGIVAVVMIVMAGVRYITAEGNPEKGAAARQQIYRAVIGLGIVLVATAAVSFIGGRLG